MYMKSRKSCSETRKFRIKFPGRPVSNSSTIRRLDKRFKETGSVKNINVNRRWHVLTEETLDEIGERLELTPQKFLKRLLQETGVSVSSVQRTTKLLKLKPYKIPVVHALHQPDPNKSLRFCNWVLDREAAGRPGKAASDSRLWPRLIQYINDSVLSDKFTFSYFIAFLFLIITLPIITKLYFFFLYL